MSTTSKATRINRYTRAIAGIQKYFSKTKSVTLAGDTYDPAKLVATFQANIDAIDRANTLKAEWRAAVADQRAKEALAARARASLQAFVLGTYGNRAGVLNDFGLEPKKVTKKSTATKKVAAEKMRATRQARGTMGAKQRKKVKAQA